MTKPARLLQKVFNTEHVTKAENLAIISGISASALMETAGTAIAIRCMRILYKSKKILLL